MKSNVVLHTIDIRFLPPRMSALSNLYFKIVKAQMLRQRLTLLRLGRTAFLSSLKVTEIEHVSTMSRNLGAGVLL